MHAFNATIIIINGETPTQPKPTLERCVLALIGPPKAVKKVIPTSQLVTGHALGRSRGGCSAKLHLLVDGVGHLLSFVVTGGQVHETTAVEAILKEAT